MAPETVRRFCYLHTSIPSCAVEGSIMELWGRNSSNGVQSRFDSRTETGYGYSFEVSYDDSKKIPTFNIEKYMSLGILEYPGNMFELMQYFDDEFTENEILEYEKIYIDSKEYPDTDDYDESDYEFDPQAQHYEDLYGNLYHDYFHDSDSISDDESHDSDGFEIVGGKGR